MVFIQPTSPLVNKEDIDTGINLILKQNYDSVFSVYKEHWIPRWSLSVKPIDWDIQNRPRRQDFDENNLIYDENGSVYIFKNKIFIEKNNRLGGKIGHYIFKEEYGKQIDTLLDFELLETIGKYLKRIENE